MSTATAATPSTLPALGPHLQGQTFVVIGGSSGIGLGAARLAKQHGAQVVLMGRSAKRLDDAASELQGARTVQVDITDEASVRRAFDSIGTVDHLVITAGALVLKPIAQGTTAEWNGVFSERVVGVLVAVQSALPHLSKRGSITLMSGGFARRPVAGSVPVAAAVAAVELIAKGLAVELAPVRVNAIAPGWVDTPLVDAVLGQAKNDVLAGVAAKLPSGRVGNVEDTARAILFLATSGYVTGEVINIDGGFQLVSP